MTEKEEVAIAAKVITDKAEKVARDLRIYRRMTVVYSVICAGVVALVMAYFLSNELNGGVRENQGRIEAAQDRAFDEQVAACVRGGINRTEKLNDAIFTEANAVYMASQEDDPEIKTGWIDLRDHEIQRQQDIRDEADRIGFRLPGTVINDCEKVVATP